MRTTRDLDEDVLLAAEELAAHEGKTAGQVLSELASRALNRHAEVGELRNGVPLLPSLPLARPVTLGLVNRLREGSGQEAPRGSAIFT